MSDPFVGEIKMWMMSWAPQGWALCDGSILPIMQNQALYALLGTQFGGDGQKTFGLPDLRGRVPIGSSPIAASGRSAYLTGNSGGLEAVTITPNQAPPHSHLVVADANLGNALVPTGGYLATAASAASNLAYATSAAASSPGALNAALFVGSGSSTGTLSSAGGNQPHANMQPFTVVNFTICTSGLWPPRP
jgi:microcystin-dependent protein